MKTSLTTILIFTLFEIVSVGQKIDTTYYDWRDRKTTNKRYLYYRVARQDSNVVRVFDYYKPGQLKMSGGFKTFEFLEKTGPFNYYSNNRITHIELYEPSKYPNFLLKFKSILENFPPQPDSLKLEIFYYKNLNIKAIGYISECCHRFGQWYFFSEDNKLKEIANFINDKYDGPFIYFPDNYLGLIGSYKNNKKDGEWKYFSREGKLILTEYYLNNKKIKSIR